MGIREQLNQKPAIVTGATIGVIVLALIFIVYELHGSSTEGQVSASASRYYSDDDGATYFADAASKMAPFDHNGKPAAVAYVYKCKDGKPFVAFLQRYTQKGLKTITQYQNDKDKAQMVAQAMMEELEVSRPGVGEKGWYKIMSPNAAKVMAVNCPAGGADVPQPLEP